MKIIKFLIFLIYLSSCNKYVGSVDPDYIPTNEVSEIFSNTQTIHNKKKIDMGSILYPKSINPDLAINYSKIHKITNTNKKTVLRFFQNLIFLSKDKKVFVIDSTIDKNTYVYDLTLNKEEYVIHFFEFENKIYLITNRSRLFLLDGKNASVLIDYGIYTNTIPIEFNNSLIIFSVFGDIIQINLADLSISNKGSFNPNPGITINSDYYEDHTSLYYLFNTGTLVTFDKDDFEYYNNYILEDLNILSSLGFFDELVIAPFSYKGNLYFLDRSGKIAVYNPISSDILWEFDINGIVLDYLFSNDGYLIILTYEKILIISSEGNIMNSYPHDTDLPISIFKNQENIYLISENGITTMNFEDKSKDILIKNKFTSNLDIFYKDRNIYLKDDKSFFKLSE